MLNEEIHAVSVLSVLVPKSVGVKPFSIALSISCLVKSPSGPINTSWFLVASTTFLV